MQSLPLDYPIETIPQCLKREFPHECADNEKFLYRVVVDRVRWDRGASISGNCVITKYKILKRKHWWNKKKVRLWRVGTGPFTQTIIEEDGFQANSRYSGVRQSLEEAAIRMGILPTELLFDRSLGPIEKRLAAERQRIVDELKKQRMRLAS